MPGGRIRGRSGPEPLAPLIESLLGRLGYRKRAPALFAMAAWPGAVGDAVAQHAVPERVEHDTLHVVVDGAPWANELRWMEGSLVAQLNAACGRDVVARLRFRVGSLPTPPGVVRRVGVSAPGSQARAAAAALSAGLSPAMAAAWTRLVAKGLTRAPAQTTEEDDA